jgi:hypothetical protein
MIHTSSDCEDLITVYPSLLNDLYPDCNDAGDEKLLVSSWVVEQNDTRCHDSNSIPCHAGLFDICYPRHEICTYKENRMGLLMPCRNAGHLSSCWFHECPTMFKCPEAYCIPYNMMCDRIAQCPQGQDEANCTYSSQRLCPGLFRCKDTHICIHVSQLCDGQVDCPVRGEDEKMCNPCPDRCVCLSLSYDCSGAQLYVIPMVGSTIMALLMKHNNIIELALTSCFTLIKLDMQWNQITQITANNLKECSNLLILYLQGNVITQLDRGAFGSLSHLMELNIANNPLVVLSAHCFEGLSSLPSLTIDSPYLRRLPDCLFTDLISLSSLELSNVLIEKLHYNLLCTMTALKDVTIINTTFKYVIGQPFAGLPLLSNIITSQKFICCSVPNQAKCITESIAQIGCLDSKLYYRTSLAQSIGGASLLCLNTVSLLFWTSSKTKKRFLFFICLLNISDMLMGARSLLFFAALHYYTVAASYWSVEYWTPYWFCGVAMICAQVSFQMSSLILFVNSIDRLLLTKYAVRRNELTIRRLSGIYVAGLLISISMSLITIMQAKINSGMCVFITISASTYIQGLMFSYHLILAVGFLAFSVSMIHFLSTRKRPRANKSRTNVQKERIMLVRLSLSTISNVLIIICVLILQVIKLGKWDSSITYLPLIEAHVLLVNVLIHAFTETFIASKFSLFINKCVTKTIC